MNINFEELSSEFKNNIKFDYDLKKKNWFNIGGNTKIFYKAENLKELIKFLKLIENNSGSTNKHAGRRKRGCGSPDNGHTPIKPHQ